VRTPSLDRLGSSQGAEAPLLHRISLGATGRLMLALGKTIGLGRRNNRNRVPRIEGRVGLSRRDIAASAHRNARDAATVAQLENH
jgi:hypothetical protein